MNLKAILKMNIKPFLYHTFLVVIGMGIVALNWNINRNEGVLVAFLLMVILHYVAGFLLTNYESWYKNLLSVIGVILFNILLLLYSFYVDFEMESLMDFLAIAYRLPFLYILGWHGPNYPILVSFLPSILMLLGLQSKVLFLRLKA